MAGFNVSVQMSITKVDGDVESKFSEYVANYHNLPYEGMHGVQSAVIATLVQLGDNNNADGEEKV